MTLREKAIALLGTWSRPPDLPAKLALALGVALALAAVAGRGRSLLSGLTLETDPDAPVERRRFVRIVGVLAAIASIAYIAIYLRGGPRIVDATTYFLQGRALAHGDLSWTPPNGPTASFSGRFLIHRELGADGTSLGGIFPPGYPLLLSLGFMLGAPMIVGPILAFSLVVATYQLARAIAEEARPELAEPIARGAALLSLLCAALRYHTADTMSHGAAALGVTVALTAALRARQARARSSIPSVRAHEEGSPFARGRGEALLAGLAIGYVVATRPVSAVPSTIVALWLLVTAARPLPSSRPSRLAIPALLGMLPGVLLLLLAQRAVTGSWLESTQRMYYALSDGPPGCFRWGFGKGTGCVFEHGDFVEARLKGGFGLLEAAGTTLRRLHAHVLDVANLEPLALLVLLPAIRRRRFANAGSILPATALVGLQMLAYLPFYFDGDYPGGGARFFADVLPVEHVLVMVGLASLVKNANAEGSMDVPFARRAFAVLGLAAIGFGVHASFEHQKLQVRDGGRPMFEPDVLARASVTSGLVFVDTDHGFALGHDPHARPDKRVLVARLRGDDHDRMLFEAMGRPTTWLYRLEPAAPSTESTATLTPWTPPESTASLRFEAEAEWPALDQADGFASPVWTNECASAKRGLALTPSPGQRGRATITIPVPSAGQWTVEPHVVRMADGRQASVEATIRLGGEQWVWKPSPTETCTILASKVVTLTPPRVEVTLEANGGPFAVDDFILRKVP